MQLNKHFHQGAVSYDRATAEILVDYLRGDNKLAEMLSTYEYINYLKQIYPFKGSDKNRGYWNGVWSRVRKHLDYEQQGTTHYTMYLVYGLKDEQSK